MYFLKLNFLQEFIQAFIFHYHNVMLVCLNILVAKEDNWY